MSYMKVAKDIFNWLDQYQILQREIKAQYENEHIKFILDHPLEGKIEIVQPIPEEKYFRCHGIGLEIIQKQNRQLTLGVYDYGGIFDPIDYSVPGEHYATTHYALLGAILFRENQDNDILEKVKRAINFHLHTSKDEYNFDSWGYHWDFQNYAFLETYRLVGDFLSTIELTQWQKGLKAWRENYKNPLTNWVAMRAYSALLRHKLIGLPSDKLKYWWRLLTLNKARHPDGCYDDEFNQSRPIQYHVFTLAMLHRMFLLNQNNQVRKNFIAGVNYFLKFIDPDGCFNYLGRGQEQIFGYAAGLYVLEAAKELDNQNASIYQFNRDRMWDYLLSFQKDGYFPLVLNDRKDEEKFGWYDYHHLTVYVAFLGAWLGFTHLLNRKTISLDNERPGRSTIFFQPTNNIIVSKDEYFIALSGGTPEYLSEPGITPTHLWFKDVGWVFSCPGGPSPHNFGKINLMENVEKNVLAPIARQDDSAWMLPAYKVCQSIEVLPDSVSMIFDYGLFILNRLILFKQKELIFEDNFEFKKNGIISELRYFNFPVVIDKFKIEIKQSKEVRLISDNGGIKLSLLDTNFNLKKFDKCENVKSAKGLARIISLREYNLNVKTKQKNYIKFSFSQLSA